MKEYKPEDKTKKILDIAMDHINSVPYKVSLRWLFYRLLQAGLYKNKEDYKKFKDGALSKARKRFYGEWRPYTLEDDTRPFYNYGRGYKDLKEWGKEVSVILDKFYNQKYYMEIWFEAKAMKGQFEHYTQHIPLVPFGGDYSISPKWDTARRLANASKELNKPVVILYFGDCDSKGLQIPKSALKDIREWAITGDNNDKPYRVNFEFVYCGLTLEQAKAYNLLENPDKPKEYQWEALTDEQAKKIIISNVSKYQNDNNFTKIEELETKYENKIRKFVENINK